MMGRMMCVAAAWALLVGGVWGRPKAAPRRWVYVSTNLYVDRNVTELAALLTRARDAGYNGVLLADTKTLTWWQLDDAERWSANARRVRDLTRRLGLALHVAVFPFGYSGSLLWHDPNLAAGLPLREVPLVARRGRLEPVGTAAVTNGSFEEHRGHRVTGWLFQDNPGVGSFIDTRIKHDGQASIRFENVATANEHGHGRICQTMAVRPWQQYRLRVWLRAEDLTANTLQILVIGGGRTLQFQAPQVTRDGRRQYVRSPRHLHTDWVEQRVCFNSLDHTEVKVYLGVWGGQGGGIWWDDLRIEDVPTLNLLRRKGLPLVLRGEDGTVYEEGRDVTPVVDPGLGRRPWSGVYDTRHEPPAIRLTEDTRIRPGQRVFLSGYHATLVYQGQVACSLDDPAVFALCREQVRRVRETLAPDGYFMSHDEIRCGGWEPNQVASYPTSGALLAANVRRCTRILHEEDPGKPSAVWSDMFDPAHNARADYYLVNNSLAGSWEGLDRDVTIMKWGGGARARPGLTFFAQRGYAQMIAAYYDGDVIANRDMWRAAAAGVAGVTGVMYTTWEHDYTDLEAFAAAWWGEASR